MSAARRGFILISALVIALVGGILIAALFTLSTSFHGIMLSQRQAYRDYIDINSYIEEAKGFIVARNKELAAAGNSVLHGRGATSDDYYKINSINDLQVNSPNNVASHLSQDVPLSSPGDVSRRLTLKVYDANYRVQDINIPAANLTRDMPPSLFPANSMNRNGFELEGAAGGTPPPISDDITLPNVYKTFGAYLIRVELFWGNTQIPMQRVDVAFSQIVR